MSFFSQTTNVQHVLRPSTRTTLLRSPDDHVLCVCCMAAGTNKPKAFGFSFRECVSTPASFVVHSNTLYIRVQSLARQLSCYGSTARAEPSGRSAGDPVRCRGVNCPCGCAKTGSMHKGRERQADRRPPPPASSASPASQGRRLHACPVVFAHTGSVCPRVANFLVFLAASAFDLFGRTSQEWRGRRLAARNRGEPCPGCEPRHVCIEKIFPG